MPRLFDEFDWIDRLKPLTRGDPRALGLADDVAVAPGEAGKDLVISKDAMVEGVHFLTGESPRLIARRLLRTALSDLAAKAATPFGYFLMTAWPIGWSSRDQEGFIEGLREDGEAFGVALLGGDTIVTPGPLTLSATVLGWTPSGRTILRSGARAGDDVMVCGVIGDGWLGLKAARGEIADPDGRLAAHYRTPEPLFAVRDALLSFATAAADVSDGLLADVFNIARASGLGAEGELDLAPRSAEAAAWRDAQPDREAAAIALATGGDDYAIVCAVAPENQAAFVRAVQLCGVPVACVGRFEGPPGLRVQLSGRPVQVGQLGWRH